MDIFDPTAKSIKEKREVKLQLLNWYSLFSCKLGNECSLCLEELYLGPITEGFCLICFNLCFVIVENLHSLRNLNLCEFSALKTGHTNGVWCRHRVMLLSSVKFGILSLE